MYPKEKPNYAGFKSEGGADFSLMEDKIYPSFGRFNFQMGDKEELLELWEKVKANQTIIEKLHTAPWGTTKFTIADLDGNELGFMEP